jgi:hypothetical protein
VTRGVSEAGGRVRSRLLIGAVDGGGKEGDGPLQRPRNGRGPYRRRSHAVRRVAGRVRSRICCCGLTRGVPPRPDGSGWAVGGAAPRRSPARGGRWRPAVLFEYVSAANVAQDLKFGLGQLPDSPGQAAGSRLLRSVLGLVLIRELIPNLAVTRGMRGLGCLTHVPRSVSNGYPAERLVTSGPSSPGFDRSVRASAVVILPDPATGRLR